MTNKNLAALKAIAKRHPRTINGIELELRGIGLVKFVDRVIQYPGVTEIILQQGANVPVLLREAPGFVVDIAVDSLLDDEELAANDPEARAAYEVWVRNLPPSEMIDLAQGVVDATMPEGWDALKKKAEPLIRQFKSAKEEKPAAARK